MYFRTASAAFLIEGGAAPTLEAVLQATGLDAAIPADSRVGFGVHDADTLAFEGEWPAVGRTWGRVDALRDRRLVQLFFSYNTFIELAPIDEAIPLDDDPLKPLVDAFRAAATALDAEVGWIDGAAHYGDDDWENSVGTPGLNAAYADRYLDEGVNALVQQHLALTWMRQDVSTEWDGPQFDRQFETTPGGWLLWPGDESNRWV